MRAEDERPILRLRATGPQRNVAWTCRLEEGGERAGAAVAVADADGCLGLPLPAGLPLGYHRLAVELGGTAAELGLIVAPAACYLPAELGPGERRGV